MNHVEISLKNVANNKWKLTVKDNFDSGNFIIKHNQNEDDMDLLARACKLSLELKEESIQAKRAYDILAASKEFSKGIIIEGTYYEHSEIKSFLEKLK